MLRRRRLQRSWSISDSSIRIAALRISWGYLNRSCGTSRIFFQNGFGSLFHDRISDFWIKWPLICFARSALWIFGWKCPFDSFSPVAFRSFRSQCPLIDCSIMGKTKRFDLLLENRISDCWVDAAFVKLCAKIIVFWPVARVR